MNFVSWIISLRTMKKALIFSLIILNFFSSSVIAKTESYSKTEVKVNDMEVRVESDQPGILDVRVEDEKVEIRASEGMTPTIFISSEKIQPTIIKKVVQEKKESLGEKYETILDWLKDFVTSIFNSFFRR